MVLRDQKWPFMTQNVSVWPQMALKHFPWEYYMKLCHAGPHLGLFRGPLGPCRPLKRPQGGLICNIIMYYAPEKCFRVISGHAGTFWVMKGHFGSRRLFIETSSLTWGWICSGGSVIVYRCHFIYHLQQWWNVMEYHTGIHMKTSHSVGSILGNLESEMFWNCFV